MTPEEVIRRHAGVTLLIARQYEGVLPLDDLLQEARIALWRESLRKPGDNLDRLASWVVRKHLNKVARNGRETGMEPGPRFSASAIAADTLDPTTRSLFDVGLGASSSAEREALREQLVQDVHEALEGLPHADDRTLAWGLLQGMSLAELSKVIEVPAATLSTRARTRVFPTLRAALSGWQPATVEG